MPVTLYLTPTTDVALDHAHSLVQAAQARRHLTPISFLLPTSDVYHCTAAALEMAWHDALRERLL